MNEHAIIERLSKTRNGRGGGLRVAFSFSGETLRLDELGVILK